MPYAQIQSPQHIYPVNFAPMSNSTIKIPVYENNEFVPLYINNEEHPYGVNAIVAIGCYGSYNVEDSILFNEGSVKRGMFNTTYLNMYGDVEMWRYG